MDIMKEKTFDLMNVINGLRQLKHDLQEMQTFFVIRGEMVYLKFEPQLAQLQVRISYWLIEFRTRFEKEPFF